MTAPTHLTDADREALYSAGDHDPLVCDCSSDLPDGDWKQVCGGLWDTFAAVEAIVQRAVTAALNDAVDAIEAVAADPDRRRPLAHDATTSTDFANDFQWAAAIVRART